MVRPRRSRHGGVALAAWWRSVQWFVVAAAALVAFALGFVGFGERFALTGEARSTLDAVYLSLQLFTLESGSIAPPVPLALEIARFLAPAVAVLGAVSAAVALLGERLSRLRLRLARDHVVVCGLGQRGLKIAEEFSAAGHRVAVIERNEADPHVAQAREAGAVVLIGDAADDLALRQARADRARYVVAVCAADGTNAAIAVHLAAVRARAGETRPVSVIVHVRDAGLCELLTQSAALSCGADGMRLEFFNVPRAGAAAMLAAVPPVARDATRAPRIAVVGLGRLGLSVALQAARRWWFERDAVPGTPELTLIGHSADERARLLRAHAPRIGQTCSVRTRSMGPDAPEFERCELMRDADGGAAFDAVYVCVDDDATALSAALTVRRCTRGARVPIAVRMSSATGLAALAAAGMGDFEDLHVVGVLDATCTVDALLGGVNESVARAVHADYVRREREAGHTADDNPSMVGWEELPEHLRESNRRQADDIGAKVRSVGRAIVPLQDWAREPDAFSSEEVELLARAEHERWMRERTGQGWRYAPGVKDIQRRTSPDLVEWERLTEDARELDRGAVRAIPALLAGAGLTMECVGER